MKSRTLISLFSQVARNTQAKEWLRICTVVVTSLGLSQTLSAQTKYEVTDLGVLQGGGSVAHGINDHTGVVGFAGFPVHAFLWRSGKIVDLGTLGGPWSTGWSINNSGEVAGAAELPQTQDIRRLCQDADLSGAHVCRAFLWRDGVLKDLGTFGGMNSVAFCINDRHEVVGVADMPDSVNAFIWEGGSLKDLGTPRGIDSAGHAINNRGQVAIDAHISRVVNPKPGEPDYHAFLWDRGIFTDLGTL